MTDQAGVKTVAIGGRPPPTASIPQMQAVGGVKGTNDYDWLSIYILANDTLTLAPYSSSYSSPSQLAFLANNSEIGQIVSATLPFERSTDGDGYVNARDGIRAGDTTGTPVQFVYEPADCRIWYEREMLYDVTAMWERVYDVTWGAGECVVGSVKTKREGSRAEGKTKKQVRATKEKARKIDQEVQDLERISREVWTDLKHWRRGNVADGVMLP